MLNVIGMSEKAPRSRGPALQRQPASADISELASGIISLQSKAKREIDHAVMKLDLAVQHARLIATRARSPAVRKNFDEHVVAIDQLLQVVRETALKL